MSQRLTCLKWAYVCACLACGCGTAAPVNEGAAARAKPPSEEVATEPGPQDPDAPTEFTTTESGLKYRVLRKGSGKTPAPSNRVFVNYKGWFDDGKTFDTSYYRGPFSFTVAAEGGRLEVIPGWNEGIQYVAEGGMIELEIPSDLGYGPEGMPPDIPPAATLHFLVELEEVQ